MIVVTGAAGRLGRRGYGDGEFYYPRALAVTPDDSLYVSDLWNYRIQKNLPVLAQ